MPGRHDLVFCRRYPTQAYVTGKNGRGGLRWPPPLSLSRLRYTYTSTTPANGSRAFFTAACTICKPTHTSRDDPHSGGGGLFPCARRTLLAAARTDGGTLRQTSAADVEQEPLASTARGLPVRRVEAEPVRQAVEVAVPSHSVTFCTRECERLTSVRNCNTM